jgi:hypothetical protein
MTQALNCLTSNSSTATTKKKKSFVNFFAQSAFEVWSPLPEYLGLQVWTTTSSLVQVMSLSGVPTREETTSKIHKGCWQNSLLCSCSVTKCSGFESWWVWNQSKYSQEVREWRKTYSLQQVTVQGGKMVHTFLGMQAQGYGAQVQKTRIADRNTSGHAQLGPQSFSWKNDTLKVH